jgi:hypothetical protein
MSLLLLINKKEKETQLKLIKMNKKSRVQI